MPQKPIEMSGRTVMLAGEKQMTKPLNPEIKIAKKIETRKKMSISQKGKKLGTHHKEETKKLISEKLKGNIPWNKGKIGIYSEDTKKKMSENQRGYQTEETREKISLGLKEAYSSGSRVVSDETRKKISNSNKGRKPSQKTLDALLLSITGRVKSEETKRKFREKMIGHSVSKETIGKIIKANTGRKASEETKQKLRESHLGYKFPESQKINHLESLLGGFWYGAVRYYDIKYCELWNEEFRERVRAFFDYQCIECGTPQNGKRLGVHHVHYDKKTCCRSGEDIGSRRFVPLCKPCHGKSGHNRPYWEQHFTDIINNYYEGKCYFTKDEMKAFQQGVTV